MAKNIYYFFQKEKGNTFTLLIKIIVKSLQKEQIAQITQSVGINLQSPQSDSTPRRLTLNFRVLLGCFRSVLKKSGISIGSTMASLKSAISSLCMFVSFCIMSLSRVSIRSLGFVFFVFFLFKHFTANITAVNAPNIDDTEHKQHTLTT